MGTNRNVVQLLRVSTEAQAGEDRASIAAQRAVCANIAKQHGLTIIDTVELTDVSGAEVLRSREMLQMLDRIRAGCVHGVVAREFSRLMRPEDFGDYAILQAFAESHTLLYLPDGPIDFASKMGRLVGTMRAAIAGMERSEIQERVFSAKEQMRREGRWPHSDHILAYGVGYDRKATRWYYKPDAEKVREVFRRFLSGEQSYNELSEFLGVSRGSARNILTNPIYTGWMVYSQKRDLSAAGKCCRADGRQGGRRKIARAPDEIIRVQVIDEPLVSEATFASVQQLIQHKTEHHVRQRRKIGQFTYNGFVWCARCGSRLYGWRSPRERFYYVCATNRNRQSNGGKGYCPETKYMDRDKFEPTVDRLFGEQLTERTFLRRIFDYQMGQIGKHSSPARMVRLQQNLERLEAKRQRLTDLYLDGGITREDRIMRIAQLDRELHQAREQMAAETPPPVMDAAGLAHIFAPFMRWPFLNREDKRRILTAIAPEIKAANYQIEGLSIGLAGCNSTSPTEMAGC
jgi:DNA invertase Pin-like site-specific DNA recombinase